jgi:hypothetical protein
MKPIDQRTVDGVPVQIGDRVWFARCDRVTHRALDKTDLGMWWTTMTSKQIYSTEQAALAALLEHERQQLREARQEVRRAAKAIERLTARLAERGAP